MKRGFSMIEVVFAIVIVGILGFFAAPKLLGLRDGADAVKINEALGAMSAYLQHYAQTQQELPIAAEELGELPSFVSVASSCGGASAPAGVFSASKICLNIGNEPCYSLQISVQQAQEDAPEQFAAQVLNVGSSKTCQKAFSQAQTDGLIESSAPGAAYTLIDFSAE